MRDADIGFLIILSYVNRVCFDAVRVESRSLGWLAVAWVSSRHRGCARWVRMAAHGSVRSRARSAFAALLIAQAWGSPSARPEDKITVPSRSSSFCPEETVVCHHLSRCCPDKHTVLIAHTPSHAQVTCTNTTATLLPPALHPPQQWWQFAFFDGILAAMSLGLFAFTWRLQILDVRLKVMINHVLARGGEDRKTGSTYQRTILSYQLGAFAA